MENKFQNIDGLFTAAMKWAYENVPCKHCGCGGNGVKSAPPTAECDPLCCLMYEATISRGAHGVFGILNPHPAVFEREGETQPQRAG